MSVVEHTRDILHLVLFSKIGQCLVQKGIEVMTSDLLSWPHGFHSSAIQASSQSDLHLASGCCCGWKSKAGVVVLKLKLSKFILKSQVRKLRCPAIEHAWASSSAQ